MCIPKQARSNTVTALFVNRQINQENVRLVCMQAAVPELPARKAWIYVAETVAKKTSTN